jgi:hypothetical protein
MVVDEHDAPVAGVVLQLLDAASHVTARALSTARNLTATTISYERDVDPVTRRVRAKTTTAISRTVQHPWLALSTDSLHRAGYVSADGDNVAGLDTNCGVMVIWTRRTY